jgi:membrane protease YdiL (CAAX protease family)
MQSTLDRKRIWIFLAIAYGISIAIGLVIYLGGGLVGRDTSGVDTAPSAALWLVALMFAPTVANLGTRLITREGWSAMMLRPKFRRGWPMYLAGLFLPILATIVGGAIYYLVFSSQFDLSMTWARQTGLVSPVGTQWGPAVHFLFLVALVIATILPVGLLLAFGEEFGWRAYLLPRLMPMGARKAVILLGVIHGAWHWPIIFMGYEYGLGYWGAPVVGPLLFLLFTTYLSAFLAWVTLRRGSVWPAALGHAAVNASALLMLFYSTGDVARLVGPMPVGIVGSLGYAGLALILFLSPRALAPVDTRQRLEPRGAQEVAEGAPV